MSSRWPLRAMRGRTLNEAFVILDEAQNTTVAQMKMFLTRMGEGSKVVVAGDVTQVDLPPHTRSGLVDALSASGRQAFTFPAARPDRRLDFILTSANLERAAPIVRVLTPQETVTSSRHLPVELTLSY